MMISNKKSPILTALDTQGHKNPFEYKMSNYPIGMKKTVHLESKKLVNIYKDHHTWEIPRSIGYLAQIILKLELAASADNLELTAFFSSRFFKYIYLRCISGGRGLQRITPHYTRMRIDNSEDISFYYNMMKPNIPWDTNTITCYVPLFLWISESPSNFLDLSSVEPLELMTITNDGVSEMGLNTGIATGSITPILTVFELANNIPKMNYTFLSYDAQDELVYALDNSSTTKTIEINNKKCVFAMHMAITNGFTSRKINSFQLKVAGKTVIDYDRFIGVEMWNKQVEYTGNTLTYWFSLDKCRTKNTFAQNFHDLENKELTVHYDSTGADYELVVFFEYFVLNKIEDRQFSRLEFY